MITYIDTSVLVKLLVAEHGSDKAREIWEASSAVAGTALVLAEAGAALAAAERAHRITAHLHDEVFRRCVSLVDQMVLVDVTRTLAARAAELARAERLRGYDAVHLAAALTIRASVLATADTALSAAAESRGLHVLAWG